jgi:broad specificity phosphatase PhoE
MVGHDGESREAFDDRAVSALQRIAKAHDGQLVVVVTHGGVVRALERHLFGEPRDVLGNCEWVEFRYEGGTFARID